MAPQAGAVTPVGQVTVHVTVWSVVPFTKALDVWVVLVITLAVVGETATVMVFVALLPPHPTTPNTSATLSNNKYFNRIMPVLPRPLDLRSVIGDLLLAPGPLSRLTFCSWLVVHPRA